jgi:Icc-related predicted phosphoesterase
VIGVLGNHDYEADEHVAIREALVGENVHILDGESVVVKDVGFAGVKGFGGGFDRYMMPMFGEPMFKQFVQECVDEALRLDRALARLDNENAEMKKIVVLHYSPIKATVEGEPEAIMPFLGSSRLVEPINRRQVVAAFPRPRPLRHAGRRNLGRRQNLQRLQTHPPTRRLRNAVLPCWKCRKSRGN